MFKLGFFKLIFRVLDVPKGLGAGPHQRGRLWSLKIENLRFWNGPYIHKFVYAYAGLCMRRHEVSCICIALITQLETVVTHLIEVQIRQKLYSNKSPRCLLSNAINHTKKLFVDQKLWSKQWAKVIFQHRFQSDLSTFKLWLLPNYQSNFNYLL